MKYPLFSAVLAFGLASAAPSFSQPASPPSMVIYNQNFSVVTEQVLLDLEQGENKILIKNIPETIQHDSVFLELPGSSGIQIREQKIPPPATEQALLRANEGNTVSFEITEPGTGKKWIREGRIIRAGRDPIVEFDGKVRFGLPGKPLFSSLGDDMLPEPSLLWEIYSPDKGVFPGELSYMAGNIDWRANYNLASSEDSDIVSLSGWFLISNASGKDFDRARVNLLAGDVSRLQNVQRRMVMRSDAAMMAAEPAPGVASRELDEYHLYTVAHPVTLGGNDNLQIEFVSASGITARREYVFDGASREKVQVFREFENTEDNKLGIPLPGGAVKLYSGQEGFKVFLGEDAVPHTPADEKIRINTGTAFDLAGERKQTDARQISSREREETYEITLRNRKKEPVEINVIERASRDDWEIRAADLPFEKIDSRTIKFKVRLKEGEEGKVSYTIRLRW